jgi:hypothetical protein
MVLKITEVTLHYLVSKIMEPVTLTTVATAIATLLLTKSLEKVGENIGGVAWEQSSKLVEQLRNKNKLPLLTTNAKEQAQPLDYGQAVLELKAVADKDSEIAQAVVDVEAAAKADPKVAPKVEEIENTLKSEQPTIQNLTKLAEKIGVVNQGTINNQTINQTII